MKPSLVIKVGGALLDSPRVAEQFCQVCQQLQQHFRLVLVHGGGQQVAALLARLGYPEQKQQGLRVTPAEQLPYVVGTLAGSQNKHWVALANQQQCRAVGLSLADGDLAICQPITSLGAVGEVGECTPQLIELLLEQNYLPVISSIGASASGELLNINADDAATAIASALKARLILLSDVAGVLNSQQQVLSQLNEQQINALINDGTIHGGMQVKVLAALAAANITGQAVFIGSWQQPQALLALISNQPFGSCIVTNPHAAQGLTPPIANHQEVSIDA